MQCPPSPKHRPASRQWLKALILSLPLAGCTTLDRQEAVFPGTRSCENFFIYEICVSDLDEDGRVDFMYFDDTREIFMFVTAQRERLRDVMPFHACAIPMTENTRDLSSQLLYGEDLGLSARLVLKGRLIRNYRDAQPAVDACYRRAQGVETAPPALDDAFLEQESWDENVD